MNLTEALRYATKPKATTTDYHKAFDRVAGEYTGSFDPKAEVPVQFYGDHLRSEGHHPQADFVDSALQGAKELGEPAVIRVDVRKFPEKHREQFAQMEPGDFYLHLDRPKAKETHAVLFQKSFTQPDTVYAFLDSIKGTPEEVKAEVERFQQAGIPVDLGRTVDPLSEDYDLWQQHFGLHKEGEVEPDFGSEEPEQYAKKEKRTGVPSIQQVMEDPAADHKFLTQQQAQYPEGSPEWEALETALWNSQGVSSDNFGGNPKQFTPPKPTPEQLAEGLAHARRHFVIERLASAAAYSAENGDSAGQQAALRVAQALGAEHYGPSVGEEGQHHPHYYDSEEGLFADDPITVKRQPVLYKGLLAYRGKAEAVREKHRTLTKPLRYSAVPSHELHPDYAPNGVAPRVGHLLGQLAQEDSDAGALAEGILRTGSHDVLPILADRLDETGHPLAQEIDWRHAPRAIRIDRALHREIGKRQVRHPDGHRVPLTAGWVLADMQDGIRRPAFSKRKALLIAKLAQADATSEEVAHSLFRLVDNQKYRDFSERLLSEPHTLTDPTTGEINVPAYLTSLTKARLQKMGHRPLDPFRYTDLRPEQNRKYKAEQVKYALDPHSGDHWEKEAEQLHQQGRKKQAERIRWWLGARDHIRKQGEWEVPEDRNQPISNSPLPDWVKRLYSIEAANQVQSLRGGIQHPATEQVLHQAHTAAMRHSFGLASHQELKEADDALEAVHTDHHLEDTDPEAHSATHLGLHSTGKQVWFAGTGSALPHLEEYAKQNPPPQAQIINPQVKYRTEKVRYSHQAFQEAVAKDPSDWTSGLVYADWLEEQGMPFHAHFVRTAATDRQKGWGMLAQSRSNRGLAPLSPFSVSAEALPQWGKWLLSVNGKETDGSGNRPSWHLSAEPEEAKRLVRGLLSEGADNHILNVEAADALVPKDNSKGEPRPEYADTKKYTAYKAPAGGMVVKQSPLAVSGQWAEGGEFVNDLQKLPTDSVDYKKERKRKKHLVVEYLRKRFRRVAGGIVTGVSPTENPSEGEGGGGE